GEANGVDVTESADMVASTPASAVGGRGVPRRARKLPSLIKPMRVKATPPKPGSNEGPPLTATDPPVVGHAVSELKYEAVDYSVLYTTQKVKKVKAWAEGTLSFFPAEQRIRLKGEDGGTLTSTHLSKSKVVEVGGELDVGIYLIQIE
ncbi:hypothetical protein GGI06_006713, partial [Coemansia sp. S85]